MSYITPDSIDSIDIEEEGEEEDDDEEKEKEEDDAPQSESKSMTQNGMSLRKKITKSFESLFTFDEDYEEGQSHKVKTILIVIITIVILTIIVVPIVVSQTKDSKWSVYGGNMSMLTFDKPEVNLSCYTVHGMTENEVYVFKVGMEPSYAFPTYCTVLSSLNLGMCVIPDIIITCIMCMIFGKQYWSTIIIDYCERNTHITCVHVSCKFINALGD